MQHIVKSLLTIADNIPVPEMFDAPFSLISYKGGGILFYANLYKYTQNEQYLRIAIELLEDGISKIEQQNVNFSLANGYAGLGWLVQHLVNINLLTIDNDYLNGIDELLIEQCTIDKENKNYDLLYGLLGKGVYFLERLPDENAKVCLHDIVNFLEIISENEGRGIFWINTLEEEVQINLGLAHGCASVMSFLSKVHRAGIEQNKIKELLRGAIDWLFREAISTNPSENSFFTHSNAGESRALAWCQGDLGILKSLVDVKDIISNSPTLNFQISELSRKISSKKYSESNIDTNGSLVDSTFCHGSSGILHLMNRIQISGQFLPKEYWIDITLRSIDENRKSGKSKTGALFYSNSKSEWIEDHGLLCGSCGIGMVFLSLLNPTFNSWDSIFLTN